MKHYLQSRLPDWLLVTAASAAAVSAVCAGFELTGSLADSTGAVVLLAAVMTALLFVLAWKRLTMLAGCAMGAAALGAAVAYAHGVDVMADEAAHGTFLFFVILIFVTLLVFLMARSRAGTGLLFILGVLVLAGAHFLQFPVPFWATFVFTAALALLFFYRLYLVSVKNARVGKITLSGYLKQAVALCLAACLLAGGVFAFVIRPLNPPTQELKLITRLQTMELLQVLGVSTTRTVLVPELSSLEEPEDTEQDRADEDAVEDESDNEVAPPEETPDWEQTQTEAADDERETNAEAQAVWYRLPVSYRILIIAGLVVMLFVLLLLLRLALRKRWHDRVRSLDNQSASVNYYEYFAKRLRRAGLGRQKTNTLREYTAMEDSALEPFTVGDADYITLTGLYEGVIYGGLPITDEQVELFESFYGEFHKNLRRELGTARYWLTCFRY